MSRYKVRPAAGETARVSRRGALRTFGAVGAGIAATAAFMKPASYAIAGNPTRLRLSWDEIAACNSPAAFAVQTGFYARHNLDIELFYQGASGQTLIQSIATDKTDAGIGLLFDWVKPLPGAGISLAAPVQRPDMLLNSTVAFERRLGASELDTTDRRIGHRSRGRPVGLSVGEAFLSPRPVRKAALEGASVFEN